MADAPIKSNDYHDYVIKDGKLVGRFEEMYRNCDNPWPETESDLEFLPTSSRVPQIINADKLSKVFSLGCGKGMHLGWLLKKCPGIKASGCDISQTAITVCRETYPEIDVRVLTVDQLPTVELDFDIILVREVVWYILDEWDRFCDHLKERYPGRKILVELSFYDNQGYGTEFFDGPDQFVAEFPFTIEEIVRYHVTKKQREGMVLVYGTI